MDYVVFVPLLMVYIIDFSVSVYVCPCLESTYYYLVFLFTRRFHILMFVQIFIELCRHLYGYQTQFYYFLAVYYQTKIRFLKRCGGANLYFLCWLATALLHFFMRYSAPYRPLPNCFFIVFVFFFKNADVVRYRTSAPFPMVVRTLWTATKMFFGF